MPVGRVHRFASIALFRTVMLSFIRVYWRPRASGHLEALGDGPCFLYGNHSNRWDPFALNCFTPWGDPTTGVMSREYWRKRFPKWAIEGLGLVPTQKRIAEPGLIRSVRRMIDEGRKIVVYPEGGTRWTGRPEPWIESTAKLFARMGIPVYPIITHGSYAAWPRWATYPRPARMEIEVLDPLHFDRTHDLEDVLAQLRAPIDFDGGVVEERLRPRWAFRPAAGIEKLLYRDPVTGQLGDLYTPDGKVVVNKEGSLKLKMLPDSRLTDEATGEIVLTSTLYERIAELPFEPDEKGVFLKARIELHIEKTFPNLEPHGSVTARLYDDVLQFSTSESDISLPLESIVNVDVERNYKLQVFAADSMYQLTFSGDSCALAWRDGLRKAMSDELQATGPIHDRRRRAD